MTYEVRVPIKGTKVRRKIDYRLFEMIFVSNDSIFPFFIAKTADGIDSFWWVGNAEKLIEGKTIEFITTPGIRYYCGYFACMSHKNHDDVCYQ